ATSLSITFHALVSDTRISLYVSHMYLHDSSHVFFFFNDTATTEIYTLSLHDALPILLFKSTDARASVVSMDNVDFVDDISTIAAGCDCVILAFGCSISWTGGVVVNCRNPFVV